MYFLAQMATPELSAQLIAQGGIMGLLLWWFMGRMERRMRATEVSNTRLARAQLMLVIGMERWNSAAKREAREMVKEIDDVHNLVEADQ